jgi:hypothetical protein
LNESGYISGSGIDANGYFTEGPQAYGHPQCKFGNWIVDTGESTGQLAGLHGSGTDALQIAGAHISGSYTGALMALSGPDAAGGGDGLGGGGVEGRREHPQNVKDRLFGGAEQGEGPVDGGPPCVLAFDGATAPPVRSRNRSSR